MLSLYSVNQPEVDLLVRTSGETRLSDFLLMQLRTAILYFTPVNWPDFSYAYLRKAILAWHWQRRTQKQVRKMIAEEQTSLDAQQRAQEELKTLASDEEHSSSSSSSISSPTSFSTSTLPDIPPPAQPLTIESLRFEYIRRLLQWQQDSDERVDPDKIFAAIATDGHIQNSVVQ